MSRPATSILTVTLNPALDIATSVERVEPGIKLRCGAPRIDPGGGGINVARVIMRLGGGCRALAVTGGTTGAHLLSLLEAEGITAHPIPIDPATRQSFAVTDTSTSAQYRFILPGPQIDAETANRILAGILDAAAQMQRGGHVVFSGSMPLGLPEDFITICAASLHRSGHHLCVDTSGTALQHLVRDPLQPPFLLRLDQSEAEQISGGALTGAEASADLAASLVRRGVAKTVVLGCGAAGSVLATAEARYFCCAADVTVVSTTGAGDSFMGALTLALSRGETPDQALRWGVAAASAAVMTPATQLCEATVVWALLDQCDISTI